MRFANGQASHKRKRERPKPCMNCNWLVFCVAPPARTRVLYYMVGCVRAAYGRALWVALSISLMSVKRRRVEVTRPSCCTARHMARHATRHSHRARFTHAQPQRIDSPLVEG